MFLSSSLHDTKQTWKYMTGACFNFFSPTLPFSTYKSSSSMAVWYFSSSSPTSFFISKSVFGSKSFPRSKILNLWCLGLKIHPKTFYFLLSGFIFIWFYITYGNFKFLRQENLKLFLLGFYRVFFFHSCSETVGNICRNMLQQFLCDKNVLWSVY